MEAWLGENKPLLGDALEHMEDSAEYAYYMLGCKVTLGEVLELLEKVWVSEEGVKIN